MSNTKFKKGDIVTVVFDKLEGLISYRKKLIGKTGRVLIVGEHIKYYITDIDEHLPGYDENELRKATKDEEDKYWLWRFADV